MSNYLNELNEEQRKAVEHMQGPVMVLAGAGSGKTRVLTYRISHLLHNEIDAFNILSLTFTNKAAGEMKERIGKIVGEGEAKNLWMGTFHSVFARILRFESGRIGYPSNFTIYDTDDSRSLLKSIIKEMSLDEKVYKPSLVHHRISSAKNSLINAASYLNDTNIQSEDRQSAKPMLGEIYRRYETRCFKAGAMDFDDLLFKTCTLLQQFPEVLFKYQEKFRYILVDEFQDTNFAQYVILKQLAARFENICVVGDDAQSIYAFRGANIQNILNFKQDYPDTVTYKLEQNYRSTRNIVNAANSVISNNRQQLHKTVWTDNEEGQKIKVFRTLTDNEEGLTSAYQIFEYKTNFRLRNKDFAILYRTNAQSRAFEEALRKLNIPYRIYGGFSFYQRKEIKDILAYFRLTINHNDEEALKRVINYPGRGIGDTTVDKIILCANDHASGLWTVLENIDEFQLGINSGTRARINDFVTMIKSFASMAKSGNAFDIGSHIAKHSGILKDLYEDKSPEGLGKYENIQELLNGMREFSPPAALPQDAGENYTQEVPEGNGEMKNSGEATLAAFMQDIALLTDADGEEEDEEKDTVSLMTIHAAKGLEFPVVFIVGLEENLFPSQMALNTRGELEEERRLFYVALTRAQKQAVLSYSVSRYKWGTLYQCEPSRFIEELDEKYLEYQNLPNLPGKTGNPGRGWGSQGANLYERQEYGAGYTNEKKENFTSGNARYKSNGNGNAPAPKVPVMPGRKLTKINPQQNIPGNFSVASELNIQVGMEVKHQRFGKGKVIHLEGGYPNQKATVFFPEAGQKQLLLKFAKLEVLTP